LNPSLGGAFCIPFWVIVISCAPVEQVVLNIRAEYTGPQMDSVLCLSSWFMVN
jgi:hypothetical protein